MEEHPEKQPHNFLELIGSVAKWFWADKHVEEFVNAIRNNGWGNWNKIALCLTGGRSTGAIQVFALRWKKEMKEHPENQPADFFEITTLHYNSGCVNCNNELLTWSLKCSQCLDAS